ncbi:MAG: 3-hydroxylacyl-ACP dehydratase, partial [Pseudomonadales bacterium]|nr:3-hydroxylacyl-ACP dehydratase [Pseudomonadales bacterium]
MCDKANLVEGQGWTVEELVPHSGAMVLLDKITSCTDSSVRAELTIKENEMFMNDGKVPSWVAIEYMAQAIGAYAGVHAKLAGEPVVVGLLIGTRKFACSIPYFRPSEKLSIAADKIHEEDSG